MALKTDYKDWILAGSMQGKQRFRMIQNNDGTVSFEDVSDYSQEGDTITGSDINGINTVANNIQNSVNQCQTMASNAANSATAADNSANDARSSAQSTAADAEATAADRTAVHTDATNAHADAESAHTDATNAHSDATDAKEYRDEAKEYADNAAAIVGIGIMTEQTAGIGKPDGVTTKVDAQGTITAFNLAIDATTWAEIEEILS